MFNIYLQLGFEHILDLEGYDHILFVIALCAIYRVVEWRKILILVTAFTIGHSLTLALSALRLVNLPPDLIEFLIPLTILITALHNVLRKEKEASLEAKKWSYWNWNYILALFFGLIHGLGFSNYFRALLGQEESITLPLFAFNIGVELGQLIVVAGIMVVSYLVMNVLGAKQREWTLFISGAAAGVATMLMIG